MPSLRTIFRLTKTALSSLLELHAHWIEPERILTVGAASARARLEWRRRYVSLRGRAHMGALTVAFENRAGTTLTQKFDDRLPRPDRRSGITLCLTENQTECTMHISAPGRFKIAYALLAAIPKIALALIQAAPDIASFLRTGDAAASGRLRERFGISQASGKACILPDDLLQDAPLQASGIFSDATIVVPIFNAADDLARLLSRLDPLLCHIILIDDASDDPRIRTMLNAFSGAHDTVDVISIAQNKGFVHAVNAGLERAKGHVILLNSDALPPAGDWVARILDPILSDPTVATVTPFSNNAEIISVPCAGHHADVSPGLVDHIDLTARSIAPEYARIDMPTGIGFCMAMSRAFLDRIGGFDPAFGRGYGEEVDWCRKASLLGGRNLALASLFVGHKGGASFGAQKDARISEATKIIDARYSDYQQEVQNWIEAAPVQAQKLALSLAWLCAVSQEPVPVFIGHTMGGGAETALAAEIELALRTCPGVVVLRVGGPARWRIELTTKGFSLSGDAREESTILQLLGAITNRRLIYSCGVGGRHPLDAPRLLARLFEAQTTLDIQIHDFFSISPSWNLLNASGRYEGVPDVHSSDRAHSVPTLDGQGPVSHQEWRAHWGHIFSRADRVVAFSHASWALMCEAYPQIKGKTVVRPHALGNLPGPMSFGGRSIGILGSLNRAKGAEVVQRLAAAVPEGRRIVVIGEMDGQFIIRKPHIFHGPYDQKRIRALAESYDIGLWLIPSICPETFSFATHEALATGLPVMAFARGAQGDAVASAGNGYAIRCDPDDTRALISEIERVLLPDALAEEVQSFKR